MMAVTNQKRQAKGQPTGGEFAAHDRSEASVVLASSRYKLTMSSDVVELYYVRDDAGDYRAMPPREFAEHLGNGATPDDLRAVAMLYANDRDDSVFVSDEGLIADPGGYSEFEIDGWHLSEWGPIAQVWRQDDAAADEWDSAYIRNGLTYSIDALGIDPAKAEVYENVVRASLRAVHGFAVEDDDVQIHDGKLIVDVQTEISRDELTPRYIAQRMNDLGETYQPTDAIEQVNQKGLAVADADLAAAHSVNVTAVILAASKFGRAPTDAEAVAVASAVEFPSSSNYSAVSALAGGFLYDRTAYTSAIGSLVDNPKVGETVRSAATALLAWVKSKA